MIWKPPGIRMIGPAWRPPLSDADMTKPNPEPDMLCAVVLSHEPREAWSGVDNVFNLKGPALYLRRELVGSRAISEAAMGAISCDG